MVLSEGNIFVQEVSVVIGYVVISTSECHYIIERLKIVFVIILIIVFYIGCLMILVFQTGDITDITYHTTLQLLFPYMMMIQSFLVSTEDELIQAKRANTSIPGI